MALRLHSHTLELAPGVAVSSLACNGRWSGPWLDAKISVRHDLSVTNDTNAPVIIRSPALARDLQLASGSRVEAVYRSSSGFGCLGATSGPLSGIAGIIAASSGAQRHDQEYFLPVHHWLTAADNGPSPSARRTFRHATLGDKLLCASEPIRVREGQHVLFHFYHAGVAQGVALHLPHHDFKILALDGYPVPRQRTVDHLFLGPGERVQALVHMSSPGRWVLGALDREHRDAGFGRIIEYAHARGVAREAPLQRPNWHYDWFAQPGDQRLVTTPMELVFRPAETFTAVAARHFDVTPGTRYRLAIINLSGRHSISLRGHSVDLVAIAGTSLRGLTKDTIALPAFAKVELAFTAKAAQIELLHAPNVAASAA